MLILITALICSAEPKAALLHSAPAQAKPNEALTVDGTLQVTGHEVKEPVFKELVVLYRGPAQDYVEAKMTLQYGDLYRGVIPPARMTPPGVEYYVEGRTKKGERVPIFMTAAKPARVLVLKPD